MDKVRDNEVIARWMGLNSKPISFLGDKDITVWFWQDKPDEWFGLPEYDKSWDSLMPVVKKINQSEGTTIYNFNDLFHGLCNVDIALTRKAVLEFILWYTQIKQ